MMNFWRPLALAAALNVVAGVGVSVAQTLVVTKAPTGENVELVLNATPLGSVAADARGDATLPINLQKNLGKTEIDANVVVDVCDKTHRVLIVERGGQTAAAVPGCERREVSGLYWVRQGTSVVVDVGGPLPSVLLVKGSYDPREVTAMQAPVLPAIGLNVTGAAGIVSFRDAVTIACGNVADCTGHGVRLSFWGGGDYWINRFLGAEGGYIRPSKLTVKGSGDTYHFDSAIHPHIFTIAGKLAVPVNRARLYGRAGTNYHVATSTTSTTVDDRTVTVDGVDQVVKGGTQESKIKTEGWSWLFGGGLEVWATRSTAIFGDVSFLRLRGKETAGGDGRLNDRLMLLFAGVRVHIGG